MMATDLRTTVNDWSATVFGPGGTSLDCDEIRVDVSQFAGTQILSAACLRDAHWLSISLQQVKPDLDLLADAKLASYVKGRGAWISLCVTLTKSGEPRIEELFDREIVGTGPLDHPASAAQLIGELAVFPRMWENIPDWMVQTFGAAGEPVPVLDLVTDTVVMGDESWPYEEPWL